MADIPNDLEAHKDRQNKYDEMLHKACRCVATHQKQQRAANGQKRDLTLGLLFKSLDLIGTYFFRSLFGRFFFRLGRNGLNFGWRWREGDLSRMGDRGPANDIIIHIMRNDPVFFWSEVSQHVADIIGIKRAGLCRHPAWEIRVTDYNDAIIRHDPLVHDREFAIAAFLCGQINDHRAGLHAGHHISGPKLRRFSIGDQSCGDHNVHIRRDLTEFGQLGGRKLR